MGALDTGIATEPEPGSAPRAPSWNESLIVGCAVSRGPAPGWSPWAALVSIRTEPDSQGHIELDESGVSSQATHTPGEEMQVRRGCDRPRALRMLGQTGQDQLPPGPGTSLMEVSGSLALLPSLTTPYESVGQDY